MGALLPRSIRARFLLGSVVIILALLAVVALTVPAIAREHEIETLGARLESDAALAGDLARDGFRAGNADALDALAHRIGGDSRVRVTFIAVDGTVLGESDEDRRLMENHATRPEVVPALSGSDGRAVRHSATLGRDLLYVAVPVRDGDRVIGVARTALPLVAVDALAGRLLTSLAAGALAAVVVALALSWLVARAITRPIEQMADAAQRESALEIGDVRGPEEIQRLAGALRRAAAQVREERQATQAERDHLATLIDQLADAIYIADDAGRVELANAAARASAGEDVIGRRLVEVMRDHEALEAIAGARDGKERVGLVERSNPRRFLRVIARPLAGRQLLVVVQDLTNLRRLETMRSDFVANVSHELRRPISSLKAMAETLEEGALDDPTAARDFVGRMHREIDGLAQLVNELLSLARIERGEEPLALETRAPAQLLEDVARRMGPLASRAGVALLVEPSSASAVRADPARIEQVLANLVHNAVKFTSAGGSVRLAAADDDGVVVFSVTDTGAGIDPADIARVFERFYKTDRARAGEGTGLGLAIAKHLVQAHGGKIDASSGGPGRGSTFRFTLPRASS
jgi:two-component system phosphate regulon sensor histidine kinase PhoR